MTHPFTNPDYARTDRSGREQWTAMPPPAAVGKVTSAVAVTGGQRVGWTEQRTVASQATPENAGQPATGLGFVPDQFGPVAVGDFVTLFPIPDRDEMWAVPVGTAAGGPTTGVSNCLSKFVGWAATACLYLSVLAGADPGGCSNVAAAGPILARPFGSKVWVADATFPVAGGDALAKVYKKSDGRPGATLSVWDGSSFTDVEGVEAGCANDGSIEFAFENDPLLCSGTELDCGDNTLRLRAACVACPDPGEGGTCAEASCPDGAPEAYAFTLAGGTTDFAGLNGSWAIYYDPDSGTWTATRGGWTAVLTFDGTPGGAATLRFEFDADPTNLFVEYTVDPVPADCCADITVAYDSHAGTGTRPTGPTLANVGACGPCPSVDVPCCSPTLVQATLYATFTGVLSMLGTVTVVWDSGASKWIGTGPPMEGGGSTTVEWYCAGGGSWTLAGNDGSCSLLDLGNAASCSPFLATAGGTSVTPPPCPNGAWGCVISETPP